MTRHDPDRDARILTFIEDHTADFGFPPSIRAIGKAVGLASTSSVHHHLLQLEQAGRITREHGVARAIRVAKAEDDRDIGHMLAEHLCRSQHGLRPRKVTPCRNHLRSAEHLVYLLNECRWIESPVRLVVA